MNKEIAICIVSYFPAASLLGRIQESLDSGYSVFIFDNTAGKTSLFSAITDPNFTLMSNGLNEGMGVALNKLLKHVSSLGYFAAVYFDQDTVFTSESLSEIKKRGLMPLSKGENKLAALNFLPKENAKHSFNCVKLMVSSGTLFNLDAVQKIGFHNEHWFLEGVDYEWCGRALQHGFLLGRINDCKGVDHHINQPTERRSVMGKVYRIRIYPLKRTLGFTAGLFYLGFWGFFVGELKFGLACFRNILTHVISQSGSLLLFHLGKEVTG